MKLVSSCVLGFRLDAFIACGRSVCVCECVFFFSRNAKLFVLKLLQLSCFYLALLHIITID